MIKNIILTQIEREGILYQSKVQFLSGGFKSILNKLLLILCLSSAYMLVIFGPIISGYFNFSFISLVLYFLFLGGIFILPVYGFYLPFFLNYSKVNGRGIVYITPTGLHLIDSHNYEYISFSNFQISQVTMSLKFGTIVLGKTAYDSVKIGSLERSSDFIQIIKTEKSH